MDDDTAATYLAMSVSQFRALVGRGKLPAGKKIFGTEMVRWRKAQLDAAINVEFALPANDDFNLTTEGSDEWMDAINAA